MSNPDRIHAAPHIEDEKNVYEAGKESSYDYAHAHVLPADEHAGAFQNAITHLELGTSEAELERLEASLDSMSMERAVAIIQKLVKIHKNDQNFPGNILQDMYSFLDNPDIAANPDKYPDIVRTMKLEAILSTENSPYVSVRANVDPTDDPTMPVGTIRMWFIGIIFCAVGAFVDNLFAFRNPSISIGVQVAQLVAYPLGTFFARVLPDWRFRFFGGEHSLNPGPFNRKEHMVITIMCTISFTSPYTNYIVPVQAMPMYFNQSFAYNRGYQILLSLAVNLFGYGLAGLLRQFLVYPAICLWPATMNTLALIKAFHEGTNEPVRGPFNRIYRASREKIFLVGTLAMFFYYFFPGYIFTALSSFSWITWIAPDNVNLDAISGIYGGLGFNPWPTFDWNLSGGSGLYLPTFAVVNQTIGIIIAAFMSMGIWYTNTWNTGYLPIQSNGTYDNTGARFKVTKILDAAGHFNQQLYEAYSKPFYTAGFIVYNIWAFAGYTSALLYIALFHYKEVGQGFKGVFRSFFKKNEEEDEFAHDIHYRLMQVYKEVPDWWYLLLLVLPIAFGCAAVAAFPTGAPVAALFYGLIMPVIFILPIGIIQAVTGIPVALNILADIIGGVINAGRPNGLMYFKVWAYLSSWQALSFLNDMKLAHYLKIPPRITFSAQIIATVIFSIVTSLQFNFVMGLKDVCTPDASFHFTCPYQTSYYTATIFWGVISPKKLFGPGQQYNMMLLGFPLGIVLTLGYWLARKKFPRSEVIRQFHPVMLAMGPWNYVIGAAFSCGIALCALVIFFALEIPKDGALYIDWWGNNVGSLGCEGTGGCARLAVPDVGYFGPAPGTYA
nr:OPT family small oligopeptide transporter [Kwoniella shandongensis]KAA5524476.1 OPT family small oligopeptide transporter [Kwoniella shandongensis]